MGVLLSTYMYVPGALFVWPSFSSGHYMGNRLDTIVMMALRVELAAVALGKERPVIVHVIVCRLVWFIGGM